MDPIIIIGSGLAGYYAAREFRKLNKETPLVIVTADSGPFYSKPTCLSGNWRRSVSPGISTLALCAWRVASRNGGKLADRRDRGRYQVDVPGPRRAFAGIRAERQGNGGTCGTYPATAGDTSLDCRQPVLVMREQPCPQLWPRAWQWHPSAAATGNRRVPGQAASAWP